MTENDSQSKERFTLNFINLKIFFFVKFNKNQKYELKFKQIFSVILMTRNTGLTLNWYFACVNFKPTHFSFF